MLIRRLKLKNFRCFLQSTFDFTAPVTIIQGNNGSGKTTLLEALHYGCYLRSFRTHLPQELLSDASDTPGFHVAITTDQDEITIGIQGKKRLLKVNGAITDSYQTLAGSYRVITFIEDDLQYIKGYPEARRTFIDQALLVKNKEYYQLLRKARKILDQRAHMLQQFPVNHEQYDLWTHELVQVNDLITHARIAYIQELNGAIQRVTRVYGADDILRLVYRPKRMVQSQQDYDLLQHDELRTKRTLYGFHLDDIDFIVYDRSSRAFASRGQQKLAIMLLKLAQATLLQGKLVLLIDDFITDFDAVRIEKLLGLIFTLDVQVIITLPQQHEHLLALCQQHGQVQQITL